MSAIYGAITLGSGPVDREAMSSLAHELHDISPDGVWSGEFGSAGLGIGLREVVPEDQFIRGPITHQNGRFSLVGDGLIHNRLELHQMLQLTTEETATWSDAAWMLAAFSRWGETCIEKLVGEYCFAVWDARDQTLTLLRHPTGHARTLFYWSNGRKLVFSTQMQALFSVPEVPRVLNEQKLADFLFLNHMDHHSTHFEGIYRLPPACALSVTPEGIREQGPHKIWQFDSAKRLKFKNNEDYIAAFDEIFDRVIWDNMRSNRPLGAMMSGGIDSSAVAARAVQNLSGDERLKSYTAVPQADFIGRSKRGWYNDESDLVKSIAAMHSQLEPNFITSEGLSPDDSLDEHFESHGQPFRSASNRVWMEEILRQAKADGVGVLLTGQTGNATISWDGEAALPEWLRRGKFVSALRGAHALTGYKDRTFRELSRKAIRVSLPDSVMRLLRPKSKKEAPIQLYSAINLDFACKHNVLKRATEMGFDHTYQDVISGREYRKHMVFDGLDYAGDVVSNWRASYGVELRDPTADLRLIEFCLGIPQEQFFVNGECRSLAKRAFSKDLPQAVLNNQLRGIQDPGWFNRIRDKQEEYQLEVERMQNSTLVSESIDLSKLAKLIEDWPEGERANEREISIQYRAVLLRSLQMARYIRWVKHENW